MKKQHTPEPWALLDNRNVEGVIVGGQGKEMHRGNLSPSQIATATQQEWMGPSERIENARRIVACVNACEGMTTDELEQKGLVAAIGNQLLDLEQQRDDWQKALGIVLATIPVKEITRAAGTVGDAVAYFKQLHQQRDELLALANNFQITGPDEDGVVWLLLHGSGTTGKAMFSLGSVERIAVQVALHLETERQSSLAKGGTA